MYTSTDFSTTDLAQHGSPWKGCEVFSPLGGILKPAEATGGHAQALEV